MVAPLPARVIQLPFRLFVHRPNSVLRVGHRFSWVAAKQPLTTAEKPWTAAEQPWTAAKQPWTAAELLARRQRNF